MYKTIQVEGKVDEMKICFFGNISYTFIRRDFEILKKYFDVDLVNSPKKKTGWLKYPSVVAKKVKNCDVIFCWFAGWHSAFAIHYAKKYKKKSIVVAGGYDAAYVPEINYGAFTNLKEKIAARYVLKNADLVLAVSKFTKNEILKKIKPIKIKLVYNSVDVEKFKPYGKKEDIIITIGEEIKLKGLETFAKASNKLLGYKFVIIGKKEKTALFKLKKENPDIILTGKLSHSDVLKWHQKAKIYCQLSYIESFGIGVAEAMACECIPIVTNRGGLPEVVGGTGFYVPYGDEKATAEAIKKALTNSDGLGKKARTRIEEKFSLKEREKVLKNLIEKIA